MWTILMRTTSLRPTLAYTPYFCLELECILWKQNSTQTNLNLRLNVKFSVAIYYSNLMTLFEHHCACENCFCALFVIYNFYLVASVYLCHQPEGRKGESELRFRGEAGSGGWTWSGRNTFWWPGQLLYFCIFTSFGHFLEYLLKENLVFFLW